MGAVAVWRSGTPRERLSWAAGLSLLLALRTLVNDIFWGTFVTTPHASIGSWSSADAMAREALTRLGGLLFDQEFGLLVYAPIYLLATLGLLFMDDRVVARRVMVVAGCYVALILCPITNVHGWTGGWSPAARFLTPVVPLVALGLPAAMRATPRILVALLLIVQIAIDGYMWQNPKNLWNDGDGTAAICARGGMTVCRYLPSFVK
jgi:hypothetical protein